MRGGEALAVRRAAGVTGGHADRVHAFSGAASRGRARQLSDGGTLHCAAAAVSSEKQPWEKKKGKPAIK